MGDGSDGNRELQYDSESLRKSYFLKKNKTSDNVKYISLPSKPSVDKTCVKRFLKAN